MGTSKKIALSAFCGALMAIAQVHADTTTVSMDTGGNLLRDQGNTLLNGGTSADGDGVILQLGWFSGANFTGTFNVIAGFGSTNTDPVPNASPSSLQMNQITIGDLTSQGGANGEFWIPELNFTLGSPTSGNNLPAAGTFLAIRFYDTLTITPSSHYNTVTSAANNWKWTAPATPPSTVNISLSESNLIWESVVRGMPGTEFHTTLQAIPEPTTVTSILIGTGLLCGPMLRRRRS
jgi:hypothetical protein